MSDSHVTPASDDAYRPLDGFALAGFLVSILFASMVLVAAVVAVAKASPIFFPIGILLVAAVAFGLCYAGQSRIRDSEGTRAGMPLARYGMGLAVVSSLGYAAFYLTVAIAVGRQADAFMMSPAEPDTGFFSHLQKGLKNPADVNLAFVLTRPATSRPKVRPGDEAAFRAAYEQVGLDAGAGELSKFKSHPLVRTLIRAGDEARIQSTGVRDWDYEKKSYKVARDYQIATPEAILDMTLQIESTEAEAEGQQRQWFVNLSRSLINKKELTPLGTAVFLLQARGRDFLEQTWLANLRKGKPFADIFGRDKTNWERLFPDTAEVGHAGKHSHRETYRKKFHALFAQPTKDGLMYFSLQHDTNAWPTWDHDKEGRLRMEHPFRMVILGSDPPSINAEGTMVLRTTRPLPLDAVQGRGVGVDWEVESIALERARAAK